MRSTVHLKILLSTPPWETTELWPPLGLLYITGSIKKSNPHNEVVIIDAFCLNLTKEQLLDRVLKEKPDVMGMNCSTHKFLAAIDTMRAIHEKDPKIVLVLGGYHATFASKQILHDYPFIKYIVKGEAEISFPRLLDSIENGTEPRDVEGVCFFDKEGKYLENKLALIKDLDSLAFPDRSLLGDFKYGYYFKGIPLTFGKFTSICSSRGCPFSCSYCSCAAFSERTWRYRTATNVVDELEMLYKQGYRECVFIDDNFTQNEERVIDICDQIKERHIHMKMLCEGRANHAGYPFLKKMKKAGFNVIYFGAESGSQRVLDYYNKRITPEKTAEAVANAKRAGMLVATSYILGAPIESREEMNETISFAESMRPHVVQYNILDMLIGTPLWDELIKEGRIGPDDWKTNHRVYDYFPEHASQEELETLVNEGYTGYINAWKNRKGIMELIHVLLLE